MDGDACDRGFLMNGYITAGLDTAIPVIFDIEVFEADVGSTGWAEGRAGF